MAIPTQTNIPHPGARHRVHACLVHVVRQWQSEKGVRRAIVKFLTPIYLPVITRAARKTLFDNEANIGLYMSQQGRASALWMDERFWKVTKRRWKKRAHNTVIIKIEIEPVELNKSHDKSLRKAVSKHL